MSRLLGAVYVTDSLKPSPVARRSTMPCVKLVLKSGSAAYVSVYGLATPPKKYVAVPFPLFTHSGALRGRTNGTVTPGWVVTWNLALHVEPGGIGSVSVRRGIQL